MTAANGLWGLLLTGSFPLPPSGAASAYTPGTPSPTPLPTLPPPTPTPTPAAAGAAETAGLVLETWMIAAGAAALALIIALAVFFIVRARRRRAPAAYAGGVTLSVGKARGRASRTASPYCRRSCGPSTACWQWWRTAWAASRTATGSASAP